MKKFKYIFYFIIKVKKLLFFFNFNVNVNEIFEITLDENNEEKRKNMLITIVQLTYPFRKIFYGLIVLTFLNTYFSDIIDKDTVLTIVTMIDAIDKSIVEGISEADELGLNKNDKPIDNSKVDDAVSNEVDKIKDKDNENNNN